MKIKKRAGGGHAWGLASPGSGEAGKEVHLQPQTFLSERADKSGGKEEIERDVIQGLVTPDSRMGDGNLGCTPDPV
jgi:hypothetical protein